MINRIGPRKKNRLENYDYTLNNPYFVTICTKDKIDWFGHIENGEMVLNKCGFIVRKQWLSLCDKYDYIELDEFIIMPNHLHAILSIKNVGTSRDLSTCMGLQSKPSTKSMKNNISNPKIKSLPQIIGAFKTTSSKLIHQTGLHQFAWQRSYYDHIIRDEKSLDDIRSYIQNNPRKWLLESDNVENINH
jgi:putative transposase